MSLSSRRQFLASALTSVPGTALVGPQATAASATATGEGGSASRPTLAATTNHPWGHSALRLAATQPEYFIFVTVPGSPGRFVYSNSIAAGARTGVGHPYNDPFMVPYYAWQRPSALGPGLWEVSESPTPKLHALKSSIYGTADWYSQTYAGATLWAASDQVKVAAIIASLRDHLLPNFTAPIAPLQSQAADARLAEAVDRYLLGQSKMLPALGDAVDRHDAPGYKVQCTETAKFLTFMLNGFGISAREWGVVFRFDLAPGREQLTVNVDGQAMPGVAAPQHGAVEYFDRQFGKWVFVDLIYGFSGVINEQLPTAGQNMLGVPGEPLSMPEFVFALANGMDLAVLWTRRNQVELTAEERWFTVKRGRETYLSPYDPNGNEAALSTFLSVNLTPYNQYVTRRAPT